MRLAGSVIIWIEILLSGPFFVTQIIQLLGCGFVALEPLKNLARESDYKACRCYLRVIFTKTTTSFFIMNQRTITDRALLICRYRALHTDTPIGYFGGTILNEFARGQQRN